MNMKEQAAKQTQFELITLRNENQRLRQMLAQHDEVTRFLAAALTGACARFEDPKQAAVHAMSATDHLMNLLTTSSKIAEEEEKAQEQEPQGRVTAEEAENFQVADTKFEGQISQPTTTPGGAA